MALTEDSRHRLYQRLEVVLGEEQAATLMEHLPPVGWADVATKRDVDHAVVLMKRDLDEAVMVMRHEYGTLRNDFDAFRAEIHRDMDVFRTELRNEMDAFRTEVKRELAEVRGDLALCATKQDVEELRAEFNAFRFEMRAEFATFTAAIERSLRRQAQGMVAAFTAFATLMIAVNALLLR
jgi:hypothetical protein